MGQAMTDFSHKGAGYDEKKYGISGSPNQDLTGYCDCRALFHETDIRDCSGYSHSRCYRVSADKFSQFLSGLCAV